VIYFTSDPHYWHQNVIKYCNRPYASVEEMNEDMILKWNSIVRPEDEIYVLGDFSMAFRPVELYTNRLMGTKYLVPGNHDFCHSYHKKSRNKENQKIWIQKYRDYGWDVIPEQTVLELNGKAIFNLCHHPYQDYDPNDKGHDDKYRNWRPLDDGRILLCGHIHEKWTTRRSIKGSLMINVGVDVHNFTPISVDRVMEIIAEERKS
jgi:calcineurin-like phosphoesterase family protein